MGVIMQAFYWDCPKLENKEYQWWNHVKSQIPILKKAGFTALWLPPASKAASHPSMGYDVYDYFDLGNFDQKGSQKTWFGSRGELISLIRYAHENEMQVYADLVLNPNNGGDSQELNPLDNINRRIKFDPQSEKFHRNCKCLQPSPYETWDGETFEYLPELCAGVPEVWGYFLFEYARWIIEYVGFDGFRYDFVKSYDSWICNSIQELKITRNGQPFKPYGVGECWDSHHAICQWLDQTNYCSDNPVDAFDFPLQERLKNLCDTYGYSLKSLAEHGTILTDRPSDAVTFVGNHDISRNNDIINDKLLAYAFILTHEGYPCVFWQDYYNYGLAETHSNKGIAALVRIHEEYAGGTTSILHVDDNLYLMQRNGFENQKGLIFVLNNQGNAWNGRRVKTNWKNTKFVPAAWYSHGEAEPPMEKWTDGEGWGEFWAPPRGYVVYLPAQG